MLLELIGFAFCPFAQRTVITLNEKEVAFKLTLIDLDQPPDWFLRISPFGKVPLLRVDEQVLFESTVINEYLDETYSPQLHPQDPFERAQQRAWIEYGSSLLFEQFALLTAPTEADYLQKRQALFTRFKLLAAQKSAYQYWHDDQFRLIDAAYAPLFLRFRLLAAQDPVLWQGLPSPLHTWADALLTRPAVACSMLDEFAVRYQAYLLAKGSWLLQS